jgi:anti-sigma factor RsiW
VSEAHSLTCQELIDFIAAYLDGELSDEEKHRFDDHLRVCRACVDYLDSYRETMRATLVAYDGENDIPDSVPEDLVQAVLSSRRR